MAEKALSEKEIEALVAALAVEEDAPTTVARRISQLDRAIKVYDFRRPEKFSKDHLRALRILHETFARVLASSLTSYVRTNTQVQLTMVEPVTYEEYIRTLPGQTVIYIVTLEPLQGQIVLELDLAVARVMLDRLLGGTGLLSSRQRPLTDIELALLKTLGAFLASRLCEAWATVAPLEPAVQEPILSPEFVQVTLAGETTVMLVHEITLLKSVGTLSICFPHPVLQPIMDRLKAQVWFSSAHQRATDQEQRDPEQELGQVPVSLVVELGRAQISLRELMNLSEGQVIKLDVSTNGDLPIRIGEHVKFSGRPGALGRNLGVQITRRHD